MFTRFFTFLLLGLLLSTQTSFGISEVDKLNQEISSKRNSIKEIEQSIEASKKKVEELQGETVSLENQIAILDNHVIQVELDIDATVTKLEALDLEITSLSQQIDTKEHVIERQKTIIAELLRTLYQDGGDNMIRLLATYESFSEFYDRAHYLRQVEQDIGQSVKVLKVAKVELEDKKEQTEERTVCI